MNLKKENIGNFLDNWQIYEDENGDKFIQDVEYADEYRVLLTTGGCETYEALVSFDKKERVYYVDLENLYRHESGSRVEVESALFEATNYSGWRPIEDAEQ